MPTKLSRLQITLSPGVRKALERIHRATGKPLSSIISELLAGSEHVLDSMADAMEVAASKPAEAVQFMTSALDRAVSEARQQSLELQVKRGPTPGVPRSKPKRGRR